MTPDPGREAMMEPRAPLTLGPPQAEKCERCGEPAERRARFWKPTIGGDLEPDDDDLDPEDEPGDGESHDFDLCDTCYLLWAKSSDMTPEENLEFWSNYDDGRDE
jgi:hypothetical protein